MAFFSVDGITTRAMWPKALVGDQPLATMENWRLLPTAYDGLEERIIVEGAGTPKPRVLLTHPELEEQGELKEMVIRVQGVVSALDVKVLGNWSDNEEHAPKAAQYLTLVSGGSGPAFSLQREGLLHLEELVMTALGEPFMGEIGRNGAVNLRRRVFERVHPCDDVKAIKLTDKDDPGAKARKLSSRWAVDHRIKLGIQDKRGRVTITSPLSIHRGDFVDVAAKVEIIRIRGRFSRRTEVMLCPTEIVRIRSAAEVKAITEVPCTSMLNKSMVTPNVAPVPSGFTFRLSGGGADGIDEEDMDED